jgi:arylsulfatase A
MAAEMDRVVGRLVTAIDRLGLGENTLILFTGDNGTAGRSIIRFENGKYLRDPVYSVHNGRRVQGGKTKLTNGGTNVPLIAAWKGKIHGGQVVDDLVDFSDFLPTLTDLSGGKRPAEVSKPNADAGRMPKPVGSTGFVPGTTNCTTMVGSSI